MDKRERRNKELPLFWFWILGGLTAGVSWLLIFMFWVGVWARMATSRILAVSTRGMDWANYDEREVLEWTHTVVWVAFVWVPLLLLLMVAASGVPGLVFLYLVVLTGYVWAWTKPKYERSEADVAILSTVIVTWAKMKMRWSHQQLRWQLWSAANVDPWVEKYGQTLDHELDKIKAWVAEKLSQ